MKILLVQTGFLGDVILSTPVIEQLENLYPGSELHVLTTPLARELVDYHPLVAKTLTFDKRGGRKGFGGLRQMAAELRQESYDAAYSLHKSWRTATLLWLAKIPCRYGFKEASGRFLYTKTVPRSDLEHDALRNLAILRVHNLDPEEIACPLRVELSPEARQTAAELLRPVSGKRLVGIAPGSVWATKRWTPEGFAAVAKMFSEVGFALVLLGGPDDKAIAEEVASKSGVPLLNLAGICSLIVSAAVIDRLDLLLTNDSAPLHLGSAMQTPLAAVFCATVPEFGYGPWMVSSVTLGVSGLDCRPCGRHGGNHCPTGTHACQKDLSPEVVFREAMDLLDMSSEIPEQYRGETS